MLVAICIAFILGHIAFVVFGFFVLLFSRKQKTYRVVEPFVSILVAARNEEGNLPRLLQSLEELKYPKEKLEILIGDDNSEDNTYAIANAFCLRNGNARVIKITENLGRARGKSNVLATLIHEAKGEVFLITDADMKLDKDWVHGHVNAIEGHKSVSSGTTLVQPSDFWSQIQHYESVYLMGVYHTVDSLHPVTGMGNNMCITREAYEATGGYENLPFSLIEDFQLMQEARKRGHRHTQILNREVLGWSAPVPDLDAFIRQRKRWMIGITSQPWYLWILFGLYGLFLPAFVALAVLNWKTALSIFILKMVVDFCFLQMVYSRLKLSWNPLWLPAIEICLMGLNLLMTINAFTGRKVEWKGRVYGRNLKI